MGPEIVWRLQHVWPKDIPDVTETKLSDLNDDEARELVNQVEDVKREFERVFVEELLPRIPTKPTRVGLVETVRLFTSGHSMNTDFLLLLSGILSGSGGMVEQIAERYTITATEELGRFSELETHELPESGE